MREAPPTEARNSDVLGCWPRAVSWIVAEMESNTGGPEASCGWDLCFPGSESTSGQPTYSSSSSS